MPALSSPKRTPDAHVWRVHRHRPDGKSKSPDTRLYLTEHGAFRYAARLEAEGHTVTVTCATRGAWIPLSATNQEPTK